MRNPDLTFSNFDWEKKTLLSRRVAPKIILKLGPVYMEVGDPR